MWRVNVTVRQPNAEFESPENEADTVAEFIFVNRDFIIILFQQL